MQDKKPNEKKVFIKNLLVKFGGVFLILSYLVYLSLDINFNSIILTILIPNIIGFGGLFLMLYGFSDFDDSSKEVKEVGQNQLREYEYNKKVPKKGVKKIYLYVSNIIIKNKKISCILLIVIITLFFSVNLYKYKKDSEIYCLSSIKYASNNYRIYDLNELKIFKNQDEALLYCKKIIFPKVKNRKPLESFFNK